MKLDDMFASFVTYGAIHKIPIHNFLRFPLYRQLCFKDFDRYQAGRSIWFKRSEQWKHVVQDYFNSVANHTVASRP